MKKIAVLLVTLLAVILICGSAYADANSWAQVYQDEETRITTDLTSFQDMGESFRIREKYEYLTDWTRELVSLGKKEKIWSTVKEMEYKKSEAAYKVISETHYNKDNAAVLTEKGDSKDWQYAIPTSNQEKCWQAHTRFMKFKQQCK